MINVFQVGVSTTCNGRCVYCPLTIYRDKWVGRFMEFSLFQRVIEEGVGAGVKYVHLQGWGEPLLHPQFLEMLMLARRHFSVGFTTNGVLLAGSLANGIVKTGVDILAVTFAGARAETHNRYRPGNDFNTILQNLRRLSPQLKALGTRIVAIYMMLGDTYRELPFFVKLAAELGVDEVRLSNLSYLPHPSLWRLKVFSKMFEPEPPHVLATIREAKEVAEKSGVKLSHRRFSPWEHLECPEAPTSTLYIDADGEVYPCVYLSLPDYALRCFEEKCEKNPRLSFGNIREGIRAILKRRREFVGIFEARKKSDFIPTDPPGPCKKCYRLYWI
ncbi:putative Fe-S oxidoreductase [Pyrobaculum oguniense TE7]|uniref:Fe-S oxidoreductase n=1 Tax=Pyrobaculum oguniense (strain DSM 13380 / JCM 10595 / TE7) TaxID=698757 RepID=H6Q9W0_PYROT|nr:putative Fe-S oxidoreductase [Pyrobaculum oguniense TE7]